MVTIVTRAGKGAPLTHNEVDANFTSLSQHSVMSGQMVLSKSGKAFSGYLECDGSDYDETLYPELAAAGYMGYGPAEVIDLGAYGQLIFPYQVTISGELRTFYHWDRDKDGTNAGGALRRSPYSGVDSVDDIFNGGSRVTDDLTSRTTTLNGVEIRLPTLDGGNTHSSGVAANNGNYGGLLAVWDAANGAPPGWPIGNHWTSTIVDGAKSHSVYLGSGYVGHNGDANSFAIAVEVPDPPDSATIAGYALPDSGDLGAPAGYSYYIKY